MFYNMHGSEANIYIMCLPKTQNFNNFVHIPYLFGYKTRLSLNNPKDLDPSDMTDLDFWDCFGRKKHRLISEEIW